MKFFEAIKFLTSVNKNKNTELIKIVFLNVFLTTSELFLLFILSKLMVVESGKLINIFGLNWGIEKVLILTICMFLFVFFTQFKITYFANSLGQEIGNTFLKNYLHTIKQKDSQFDSSSLLNVIIIESNRVALKIVLPILDITSRTVLLIGLISFAFWSNAWLTTKILFLIFSVYMIFLYFSSNILFDFSKIFTINSNSRISLIQETSAHSEDIKLYSKQNLIISDFEKHGSVLARISTYIHLIGISPKILIEYSIVSGICLFYILGSNIKDIVSNDTAVFIVFLRMVPLLNQLYNSCSILRGNWFALANIKNNLENMGVKISDREIPTNWENVLFKGIEKSFFSADNSNKMSLKSWDLKLNRTGLYGIFGPSGSGKTTAAGILSGFIAPDNGKIKIDDIEVSLLANKQWFNQIAVINQSPILFKGTIADNVAFAHSDLEHNTDKIKSCLNEAGLSLAKEGLDLCHPVGENGKLLSGGQKQRVALARVLYSGRQIIIMDEPTSGLDDDNEKKMFKTLNKLSKSYCIILISHSSMLKDNLCFTERLDFNL